MQYLLKINWNNLICHQTMNLHHIATQLHLADTSPWLSKCTKNKSKRIFTFQQRRKKVVFHPLGRNKCPAITKFEREKLQCKNLIFMWEMSRLAHWFKYSFICLIINTISKRKVDSIIFAFTSTNILKIIMPRDYTNLKSL